MIELESMAVEMPEVAGHPNRVGFRGVLTVVDVASQRAPSGSKGHRVLLTRGAAEAALASLLGMALDYAPLLDRHDQRRKVGVITSAEIVGRNLEVGGYLYAKDFPEIVEEVARWGGRPGNVAACAAEFTTQGTGGHRGRTTILREQEFPPFDRRRADCLAKTARRGAPYSRVIHAESSNGLASEGARLRATLASAVQRLRELLRGPAVAVLRSSCAEIAGSGAGGLGLSFEVTDVELLDARAGVWILTKVTFTGAAILRRNRAAYEGTWIELS